MIKAYIIAHVVFDENNMVQVLCSNVSVGKDEAYNNLIKEQTSIIDAAIRAAISAPAVEKLQDIDNSSATK